MTMTENAYTTTEPSTSRKTVIFLGGLLIFALIAGIFFLYYLSTSPAFPEGGATLQIKRGMHVQQITEEAKRAGIVRSPLFLYAILTYSYDPTKIYAGTYRFEKPHSVFEVAHKLASSEVDDTHISITIPEGMTRKDIARIAVEKLPGFDTNTFLELTKNNEGYLFPETYFVPEEFAAPDLVALLAETFASELSVFAQDIQQSPFTEYEVITLASILEREANDEESMRMVSGILQNRLSIGMALQADATVGYVLDKPISELTPDDLKLDTPYNTYLYPGLTPTPIGNPGALAIDAVLHPTPSDYMYYITGNDGVFYYAETFEEHKRNVSNYLR